MDITYSSAWQLGRIMANSNCAYTMGLTRVRRAIIRLAEHSLQQQTLVGEGRQEVVAGILRRPSQPPELSIHS